MKTRVNGDGELRMRQRNKCRVANDVEGAVPMSARVCDFNPRKTCLAELGGVGKESK